mmetsp:Transcript_6530/g.9932  ORF Transcript_6530/g.9932 Transcript_6530/m.9932 type:complete len:85 (+) Transcript_6530:215-469(+)
MLARIRKISFSPKLPSLPPIAPLQRGTTKKIIAITISENSEDDDQGNNDNNEGGGNVQWIDRQASQNDHDERRKGTNFQCHVSS